MLVSCACAFLHCLTKLISEDKNVNAWVCFMNDWRACAYGL